MPGQWRQVWHQSQPVKARLGDARPVKASDINSSRLRQGWVMPGQWRQGCRRLLRGGGAAEGDGGAHPPLGNSNTISTSGDGGGHCGQQRRGVGARGRRGDESTPPPSPPAPTVRRSRRLRLAQGDIFPPTQGSWDGGGRRRNALPVVSSPTRA